MRALRSCDFCGERAVGTFEVVPEELDPTEAERRRVMLCESCKGTLQTLIEPLVDRTSDATASQRTDSETETSAESSRDDGSETDDGRTNDLIESTADEDGSLLGQPDDGADDDTSGKADSSEADPDETTGESGEPDHAEELPTTAETDATQNGQSGSASKSDRPDNYGRVLRLLRNREFPMTREDIVTIATSAYQLDARNVQAVIDEAIDRGEFVEADGQLQHA